MSARFLTRCQEWLERAGLSPERARLVISKPDAIPLFEKAFTPKTANPVSNYELLEAIGDKTANKCILWYLARRFPSLLTNDAKEIVAKLKMNYISYRTFSRFGETLGFSEFLPDNVTEYQQKKLREDFFEALIAVIEILVNRHVGDGMGCAMCYHFIEGLMEQEEIVLDHTIIDAVSRLKELVESYPKTNRVIGTTRYDDLKRRPIRPPLQRVAIDALWHRLLHNGKQVGVVAASDSLDGLWGAFQTYERGDVIPGRLFPLDETLIGVGVGLDPNGQEAKQQAAENALTYLRREFGITDGIRPIFQELGS